MSTSHMIFNGPQTQNFFALLVVVSWKKIKGKPGGLCSKTTTSAPTADHLYSNEKLTLPPTYYREGTYAQGSYPSTAWL